MDCIDCAYIDVCPLANRNVDCESEVFESDYQDSEFSAFLEQQKKEV